jgi:thioredoxin-dependent peroxiredoxin
MRNPAQLYFAALLFVCAASSYTQASAAQTSSAQTSAAELAVGDVAPDFRLAGSDGQYYSLAQFRDQQYVVIAFFPKAFTGG